MEHTGCVELLYYEFNKLPRELPRYRKLPSSSLYCVYFSTINVVVVPMWMKHNFPKLLKMTLKSHYCRCVCMSVALVRRDSKPFETCLKFNTNKSCNVSKPLMFTHPASRRPLYSKGCQRNERRKKKSSVTKSSCFLDIMFAFESDRRLCGWGGFRMSLTCQLG